MEKNYNAKIVESSKEFSARERLALKDIRNAISLDGELTAGEESIFITPADYAVLEIHNEEAKGDKDYIKYVILDAGGSKFVTGSKSFYRSFREIWDEMKEDAPDEEFQIEVYKRDSKNYAGKYFITCSIV